MTQLPRPGERWTALELALIENMLGVFGLYPFITTAPIVRHPGGLPILTVTLPRCTVRIGVVAQVTAVRPQPEPEAQGE